MNYKKALEIFARKPQFYLEKNYIFGILKIIIALNLKLKSTAGAPNKTRGDFVSILDYLFYLLRAETSGRV